MGVTGTGSVRGTEAPRTDSLEPSAPLEEHADDGRISMFFSVFPQHTNHYHTLFGGTAMAWMDQAAFICATRWCRGNVVTVHTSEIDFRHSVAEGSIVEVT